MKFIECPRDAMQGIETFIPTNRKIAYINQLLKVGFDTIDFGSFVSPKAIPQLRDTAEVLAGLDLSSTQTKLLAIIANARGAADACHFDQIQYLGYPFSISETFQKRNTNATIEESLSRVEEIQNLAKSHKKQLVIYISMAFGNPYGDPWSADLVTHWSQRLVNEFGIEIIALADTVGLSTAENVKQLFSAVIPAFPKIEIGAHLHAKPKEARAKIEAALASGCKRFDSAIGGLGGCPMAEDDLVGNIATEVLLDTVKAADRKNIVEPEFVKALRLASTTFPD